MIKKIILIFSFLMLVGVLISFQPTFASEEENGIWGIGNLSGELIGWDLDIDVWHGVAILDATVRITNIGDKNIQIWWETTDTRDTISIPSNWQVQVKLKIIYDLFKNDLDVSIIGMQQNHEHKS